MNWKRRRRAALMKKILAGAGGCILAAVILTGILYGSRYVTELFENAGPEVVQFATEDPMESWESDTETWTEMSLQVQETKQNTEDWNLILVNRWNPIPEDYVVPELTQLVNGHAVDSRIYPELQQMFDDARAQGILPMISSSFRTTEYQQQLMDEKIAEYEAQGYTREAAEEQAGLWVAVPGTSEHQIGLAVDITTADWTKQDASVVWEWLEENSSRYGFILRYQEDKTEITGVMPEPWHFRYVGAEAAAEIYEQGVCLEEYLAR